MIVYNKLIRDKIPEIIESSGKTCEVRMLSNDQYLDELNKKLQEELQEYYESGDVEELADLSEIILAIAKLKGVEEKEFESIRIKKAEKRGRFEKKLFLVGVNENDDEKRR